MYLLKTVFSCTSVVLMSSVLWAENLAQVPGADPNAPPWAVSPAPVAGEGALQVVDGRYVAPMTANNTYIGQPGDYRRPGAETQSTIIPGCASRNQCPYSVTVDSIFMTMDTPSRQAVVLDQNTAATVMTTSSTDFDLETGARVRLNYQVEEDTAWQFRYFGVYNMHSNSSVFGADNLTTPGTFPVSTVDWVDADAFAASYRIRLQSVEFNVASTSEDFPMTWFVGARFFRLDERYILTVANDGQGSDYDIHSLNDMYGVHAGAYGNSCYGAWNFLSTVSMGIYSNQSRQSTFVTDDNRTAVLRHFAPKRVGIGYSAELSFEAIRRLGNGNTFLHVGYDLVWLGNVARAPDQLDFTGNSYSGSRVLWREGALAHGPSLGLEVRW